MNDLTMKNGSALLRHSASFLQVAVVLLGLAVLAFLLWEPHIEGRNAHATLFEIYFQDPFLAYVYAGSTPFFVALYRAFRLFGQVRRDGAFSPVSVEGLRAIQRCALALLGLVALGIVFILLFGDGEDRPAGVFMGLLLTSAAGGLALGAALSARVVQKALNRSAGSHAIR